MTKEKCLIMNGYWYESEAKGRSYRKIDQKRIVGKEFTTSWNKCILDIEVKKCKEMGGIFYEGKYDGHESFCIIGEENNNEDPTKEVCNKDIDEKQF